jgi:heme oxygenase
MNIDLLRQATRPEHEAVEGLMPLMGPAVTREAYIGTLEAMLGPVEAWEAWAAQHASAELQPLLGPRHRAQLLRRDLECLGAAAASHTSADASSVAMEGWGTDSCWFLGALYVMEGSTLGGQHIARHVEPLLNLSPDCGTAFFRGYGDLTGQRWREVLAALQACPDENADAVITGARAMFSVFSNALQPLAAMHAR